MILRRLAAGAVLAAATACAALAQDGIATSGDAAWQEATETGPLTALARIETRESRIVDFGRNLLVELTLSQPVPWRVFTLDDPRRLVLDFSEVDFAGSDLVDQMDSDAVNGLRTGRFRDGWSRMVLDLDAPMRIETAGLTTRVGPGAVLKLQLAPATDAEFAAAAGVPESAVFALPERADAGAVLERQKGDRPLRVTIDPGHGGFDPGAEAGETDEAALMLLFAQDLEEALEEVGMEVTLTRRGDRFVPLPARVSVAREARADLFLSLHADALAEGTASGATVYTLSEEASNEASRKLAERLDRGDLMAGVDLDAGDDEVAVVLMDMVRRTTGPRAEALADHIVTGLARATGDMHKRPRLEADFSVLRAADIPSVLVELGFLSNPADRQRLMDPVWRVRAVDGLRAGIEAWAREDALEARRLVQ